MKYIAKVDNLYKRYGNTVVFDGISLYIEPGKIIGLLGENGAGKTTLIKLLSDICKADAGNIIICEHPVCHTTHSHVAYMLESSQLYPWMRVSDAINYFSDMFSDFDKVKAFELCRKFNLELKKKIRNLSKGNQERVMLMLTFSRNVELYCLDEPIGGLDPKMKKEVMEVIASCLTADNAILISSHLLRDLEEYFDIIYILHNRKITSVSAEMIKQGNQRIEDFYMEVIGRD